MMSSYLTERFAPELTDEDDDIAEMAYLLAGGDGLDCNLPSDLTDTGSMIDGFQDADGNVITSSGKLLDVVMDDGSIKSTDPLPFKPGQVDMALIGRISRKFLMGF